MPPGVRREFSALGIRKSRTRKLNGMDVGLLRAPPLAPVPGACAISSTVIAGWLAVHHGLRKKDAVRFEDGHVEPLGNAEQDSPEPRRMARARAFPYFPGRRKNAGGGSGVGL